MKKTILALIAVLILGVVAYYSMQENEVSTTMKVEETDFSVTDTSKVTRLFIAKKNGSNFQFVKNFEGDWIVNNSWKANKFMVKMLLGTIYEMKVKAPVPKGMRNGVIKTLAAQGTKVEIYNEKGIVKTFYVGDYTADEMGTFFIMEGSENPYIVHIPRFNGYLTGRFLVTKDEFLDKAIFTSRLEDIESIKVEYHNKKESSFLIEGKSLKGIQLIDTLKLKKYKSAYSRIYAEEYIKVENDEQRNFIDSINEVGPNITISLVDIDSTKSNIIQLFDIKDNDRLIGYMPKEDKFAWVQYYVFNKILVKKEDFVKKELEF